MIGLVAGPQKAFILCQTRAELIIALYLLHAMLAWDDHHERGQVALAATNAARTRCQLVDACGCAAPCPGPWARAWPWWPFRQRGQLCQVPRTCCSLCTATHCPAPPVSAHSRCGSLAHSLHGTQVPAFRKGAHARHQAPRICMEPPNGLATIYQEQGLARCQSRVCAAKRLAASYAHDTCYAHIYICS